MDVRAQQSVSNYGLTSVIEAPSADAVDTPTGEDIIRRRTGSAKRRPVSRPIVLTRLQEYAYVRADLRRLLMIAGPLLVVMVAILFVVD